MSYLEVTIESEMRLLYIISLEEEERKKTLKLIERNLNLAEILRFTHKIQRYAKKLWQNW